jgi:hypothetical protein
MTRMCKVVCTAGTNNTQVSQISERNPSVNFELKFLCIFLSITNRLCLANVHIGGQAMLLAVFMAEDKSICHRHLHSVNKRGDITLPNTNFHFIVICITSLV